VIQVFLLVTWFAEYAFILALKMTSSMTLMPYLLVAAYGFKLAKTGDTYTPDESSTRTFNGVCGAIATVYAAAMLYAGGAKYLLLSAMLYAAGSALFFLNKREKGQVALTWAERLVFAVICIAALVGVYSFTTGVLTI
ncbi:MAG TPA: hypothetical protein VGC74_07700, partial [Stenotrophomonas sp.]